jgi:cobalamin biosynthesis protein CobW
MDALAAQRAADESLDHEDPVEEVFEDQVACADLIISRRSDLIDADGDASARGIVNEHLRAVKIVPSAHGKVDPSVLLGLGLAVEDDIENRKTHHDDELDHEHDDFDSFVLELPATASPDDLARKVTEAAEAANVLRLKGFVHVRQADAAAGAGRRPARLAYYDRAWAADEDRRTRLVVIGLKGLDRQAVERILAA